MVPTVLFELAEVGRGIEIPGFFTNLSLTRGGKTRIGALKNDDDVWVYDEDDIPNMVINHYINLFASASHDVMMLQSFHSFPPIREEDLLLINSDLFV